MSGAEVDLLGSDLAGPGRTTDHVVEVDWVGARWRLGLGIDWRDGRVRRLTIDPIDPGKQIPADLVASARHVMALASAHLPCPPEELAEFAAWDHPSPLAAALREIGAIEAEIAKSRDINSPEPVMTPAAPRP
jgi:hypothetical protein